MLIQVFTFFLSFNYQLMGPVSGILVKSRQIEFFMISRFLLKYLQVLSGDFQHAGHKMHAEKLLGMQWCAMCIFLFIKFYNFVKVIVCIYIVFLKETRPLFLYFTYCSNVYNFLTELIYLSLNKLTSKYGKELS